MMKRNLERSRERHWDMVRNMVTGLKEETKVMGLVKEYIEDRIKCKSYSHLSLVQGNNFKTLVVMWQALRDEGDKVNREKKAYKRNK